MWLGPKTYFLLVVQLSSTLCDMFMEVVNYLQFLMNAHHVTHAPSWLYLVFLLLPFIMLQKILTFLYDCVYKRKACNSFENWNIFS